MEMTAWRSWLPPIRAVVLTQFLSSLADNMNFFLIVGIVQRHGFANPQSELDVIQISFLLGYVVLAPIVGAFADKRAKSHVLLSGNLIKGLGILLLLIHVPPLICYIMLGVGAVVYSPAKYGILSELTASEGELLKANAQIEASAIMAILIGTITGGFLAKNSDLPAIIGCLLVYFLSLLVTFAVPAKPGVSSIRYGKSIASFFSDCRKMFLSRRARFSLVGTSSFWLTASVLRIALVAWLPLKLGITDTDKQSLILGITAIGVVISSFVTPYLVPHGKLYRCFYYGFLMVAILLGVIFLPYLWLTVLLLFLIGFMGGAFVIPMNTMLQEEGRELVGSGKTIAVQNMIENCLTVAGLCLYFVLTRMQVSVNFSVAGIGMILLLFMIFLATQLSGIKPSEDKSVPIKRVG